MCQLDKRYRHKTPTVYKIVAKHRVLGTYHSLAIGFKYPKSEEWSDVPIATTQNRLCYIFGESILSPWAGCGWNKLMVGRTAGFVSVRDVKSLFETWKYRTMSDYTTVIVKIELRKGLMSGWYSGKRVIAGKQMKIVGEV